MVPSVARLPLQVASTYAAAAGRPPPQVAQRWPAQFRKKRPRSPSAILMACVEIRRYASRPDSQSVYTVAGETLRRRAASLTVSRESVPTVTFSCITGALNDRRKSTKPGEGTESASPETSPDCESLPDPASLDSQCVQDWGASGRWFKSSRPDSWKAPRFLAKAAASGPSFFAVSVDCITGALDRTGPRAPEPRRQRGGAGPHGVVSQATAAATASAGPAVGSSGAMDPPYVVPFRSRSSPTSSSSSPPSESEKVQLALDTP